MSKIPYEVESLDGVAEGLHEFYEEKEGGGFAFTGVDGVDDKVKEFRTNNIALMKKLEKAEKTAGLSKEEREELDSYRTAKEKAEEDEQVKKGQWETLLAKKDEKYKSSESKWNEREGRLINMIRKTKVKADVAPYLQQYKGDYDLLSHIIDSRTTTVETDDGFDVQVLDEDGQPMLGEKGESATIEELVLALREHKTWGKAFEGVRGHGGGGLNKSKSGSGNLGSNPWDPETRNVTEQMRIMRTNPALAKTLKEQAEAAN